MNPTDLRWMAARALQHIRRNGDRALHLRVNPGDDGQPLEIMVGPGAHWFNPCFALPKGERVQDIDTNGKPSTFIRRDFAGCTLFWRAQ